ncbi:MFS transporter [Latilactobacillus sakei]|uniref:MFS transporter n=1 Tax=Latilactobacillus sakei TaxID=1599 RepID=UPI000691F247|nr:MFS transporter [Latilactobacillus sakei]ARJ72917.1 MFS transporter [Latilactobacillus sakei]AST84835.1 MFS transporter [Latilactobacillus sakei]AWZ47207.1 MFS transporter [Latilactobacillus sakei]AYG17299.1 MFS transporter [Latilactobacillus sakei]AYG26394.1 MFS transporter [Latilactobacillus sakei]
MENQNKGLRSAYALAFTCMVAFMGIGLVDPILKTIAVKLNATPAQTTLLFTSYMLVTGIIMLFTGFISTRIGAKRTISIGLIIIVLFAALAGRSQTISQLISLRAGWGFGNALFLSTALTAIVSVMPEKTEQAIMLYEGSMGIGMAVGPLVGGALGSFSWRFPFYGVAILMFVAAMTIVFLLEPIAKPVKKARFFAGAVALKNHRLRSIGIIALLYNFGFFTILAYAPFLLVGLTEMQVGFVFFGWGILLAIASVFVAPRLEQKTNTLMTLLIGLDFFLVCLVVIGINADQPVLVAFGVIIAGFFQGLVNTLLTTVAMENKTIERSVASSAYSFIRFTGGAIAPFVAGKIAEKWSAHWTFYFAGLMILIGILFVLRNQQYFITAEEEEKEIEMIDGKELL